MVSNHLASGCPAGQVEPKDSWKHGDTELMDALTRETVPHLGKTKREARLWASQAMAGHFSSSVHGLLPAEPLFWKELGAGI